jgi:hypothetical protein
VNWNKPWTLRRQQDGIQRIGGPHPIFDNAQNDVMQPGSTTQLNTTLNMDPKKPQFQKVGEKTLQRN